jgi:hypothetical protein
VSRQKQGHPRRDRSEQVRRQAEALAGYHELVLAYVAVDPDMSRFGQLAARLDAAADDGGLDEVLAAVGVTTPASLRHLLVIVAFGSAALAAGHVAGQLTTGQPDADIRQVVNDLAALGPRFSDYEDD